MSAMPRINLVPAHRRDARQHRRRLRAWLVVCVAYGVAASIAAGVTRGRATRIDRSIGDQAAAAGTRAAAARQTAELLKPRLASAKVELEASKAVTGQPDWSILLALLSAQQGEEIVLRTCQLEPGPASAAVASVYKKQPAATPPPPRLTFALAGLGRSQDAVAQFVLRLERVGLFDQITLLDTAREPFLDGSAVSFRLECVLGGKPPAGPKTAMTPSLPTAPAELSTLVSAAARGSAS